MNKRSHEDCDDGYDSNDRSGHPSQGSTDLSKDTLRPGYSCLQFSKRTGKLHEPLHGDAYLRDACPQYHQERPEGSHE